MLRAYRWALLWALLILLLCLMPGAALPAWHWADLLNVDKGAHAGLFAVLVLLCLRALQSGDAAGSSQAALLLALGCTAYGGGLELLQMLPALGRRGDWNDFAANTIGVAAGWAWHRWRKGRDLHAGRSADA